jgi:hypothetical protein
MTNETKSPAQYAPVVAASELSDEQIDKIVSEVGNKWASVGGMSRFGGRAFARAVLAAATPAASELQKERDRYERMFLAACDDLAAIADDLGINSHVEGGAAPILREIAALRAAAPSPAVQQPAEGGWVSVDERLPEAGAQVLIYTPGTRTFKVWIDERYDGGWNDWNDKEVSHWMAIPAAPTQAEGPSHD